MLFHLSLSNQRTETITVESSSSSKLLTFFQTVSKAVVRNIKEIVFSKDYKINYAPQNFIPTSIYKKVIVYAVSENYTKIYTLFNIKASVTQEQIANQFKKLYIKDEPIIDFTQILFFAHEGVLSPYDITNLYQVQYKRNNKTYIEDIYAPNWQVLKDVCIELIDGEITEIRKYLHSDNTVLKTNFTDTYKHVSITFKNSNAWHNFKIPDVKHSISNDNLITQIKDTFDLNNLSISDNEITLKYS